MKIINYIYNRNYLIWLIISPLFFLTRLVNLKIIPIFTDEAIYSYWAQVALHDPANRYISMTDGKQPLFIWLAAISQHFINDPLIATRLVSVGAGFGSLVGVYYLAKLLFNKKIGLISSFLYLVLPFTLLYDRMALYDSLLTMFCIWTVFLSVKIAKKPQLDLTIINGVTIGLALITKSSAYFYLLPFSAIFFNLRKNPKIILFRYISFLILSTVIAEIIYNSLRLSPYFYIISQKNLTFIRSFSEVVNNPLEHFMSNAESILGWVVTYTTLPMILIFLAGLIYGLAKKNIAIIYLIILIFVPLMAETLFNKVLYPRFVLFYYPFLILIIAYGIEQTINYFSAKKTFMYSLLILAVLFPAITSFKLLTNPVSAPIPTSDSNQYLNDWPAGYGVQQVIEFLKNESKNQPVNIGTEGTFGVFPYSLNIYFYKNNNVHIFSYWPVDPNNIPEQMLNLSKKQKTYFVFNENQQNFNNPYLKLINSYQKGIGKSYMRLYEVTQ
jgi:4-amino-4-deoxy-L-arabinose transferase-like glycosyltransferase